MYEVLNYTTEKLTNTIDVKDYDRAIIHGPNPTKKYEAG